MNHENQSGALNEKAAAQYVGMSVSYLQHHRCYGSTGKRMPGPAYIKLGSAVRYLISDLDHWVAKHKVQ
jgi:predicted DNA-binding transcriptional regulator AlpA